MTKKKAKPSPKAKKPPVRKPRLPVATQQPDPPEPSETVEIGDDGEPTSEGEEEEARTPPPKKTGKRGIGPKQDPEPEPLKVPGGRKQKELPGMEDRHLEDLEDLARDYATIRDKRMALNQSEADLKGQLLAMMKKHSKVVYRVEELEIKIVSTEETVKVKILEEKAD